MKKQLVSTGNVFVTPCASDALAENPLRVLMPKQQHWKMSMLMQFTITFSLGFCVLPVTDFTDKMEDNHRRLSFGYWYKLQQMFNLERYSSLDWTYSFWSYPRKHLQHNFSSYLSNSRLPSSRFYFICNQSYASCYGQLHCMWWFPTFLQRKKHTVNSRP